MLVSALILASSLLPFAAQPKAAAPLATQVRPVPDEAIRQNARLAANLSLSAKSKVQSLAVALAASTKQRPAASAAQLQSNARASVIQTFPNLRGPDIDAVVFLVMMQCAKNQEADLQQMMNDMKHGTASKQALRSTSTNSKDQLSDMSEVDQLRLQSLMDQRSKALETLSNLMKSVADTRSQIIDNLK